MEASEHDVENADEEIPRRHWNHRVIAFPDQTCDDGVFYAIHSVHYDENGKPEMMSTQASSAAGETLVELAEDLGRIMRALALPIIHYSQICPEDARKMFEETSKKAQQIREMEAAREAKEGHP